MKVPFLDLRILDDAERGALLDAVDTVFRHGRLVMGPEVRRLEDLVASSCGRRFAVGVNSGTDAVFLALKALGVGPGDEVVTTSLSWIATANAITLTGATAVFADIGADLNIDPKSVRRLMTRRTKAILPVHFTGQMCDMDRLTALAAEYGLALVEDAAQAYGATWKGRKAGAFGQLACFSMNPMKVFAACGEAGMVVTDHPKLRDRLIALRYNGCFDRERCDEPSLNGRMDTIQAALLLKRHRWLDALLAKRRRNAAYYDTKLASVVRTPPKLPGAEPVYYTYTIQAERRDELKQFLENEGIETKIQHPYLMPDQPAYTKSARGEFSNARKLQKTILCIPVHEKLSEAEREYVAAKIIRFFA
jgi:dTDP-4-amino-4,6-dideoxygalactose transaminase